MEENSYTLLKHVTGKNHAEHTPVEYIEMKIDGSADLYSFMQEFKRFLLAIGYHKNSIDEYIEDA